MILIVINKNDLASASKIQTTVHIAFGRMLGESEKVNYFGSGIGKLSAHDNAARNPINRQRLHAKDFSLVRGPNSSAGLGRSLTQRAAVEGILPAWPLSCLGTRLTHLGRLSSWSLTILPHRFSPASEF